MRNLFAFTLLFLMALAFSLYYPPDALAFEIYLNKPGMSIDLTPFKSMLNVLPIDSGVVYTSHFDSNVKVILREMGDGTAILRFQVPLSDNGESYYAHINVKVSSCPNMVSFDNSNIDGNVWHCEGSACVYNRYRVQCDGSNLFIAVYNRENVDDADVRIISSFLSHIGIDFRLSRDIFSIEKVDAPTGVVDVYDVDWSTIVHGELTWLREAGILLGISDEDIETLSTKARPGLAGYNARVGWFKCKEDKQFKWIPYMETGNPVIMRSDSGLNVDLSTIPLNPPVVNGNEAMSEDSSTPTIDSLVVPIVVLLILIAVVAIGLDFIRRRR